MSSQPAQQVSEQDPTRKPASCPSTPQTSQEQYTQCLEIPAEELLQLSGEASLEEVQELTLRNQRLNSFNGCAAALPNLCALSLSHNQIASLDFLAHLACLVSLNVNSNALTSLAGVERCTGLQSLFASNNRIRDLTPVSACVRLHTLHVFRNSLSDLDQAVAVLQQLTLLKEADLAGNPLAAVPDYKHWIIQSAPSLESLDGSTLTDLDWELASEALNNFAQPQQQSEAVITTDTSHSSNSAEVLTLDNSGPATSAETCVQHYSTQSGPQCTNSDASRHSSSAPGTPLQLRNPQGDRVCSELQANSQASVGQDLEASLTSWSQQKAHTSAGNDMRSSQSLGHSTAIAQQPDPTSAFAGLPSPGFTFPRAGSHGSADQHRAGCMSPCRPSTANLRPGTATRRPGSAYGRPGTAFGTSGGAGMTTQLFGSDILNESPLLLEYLVQQVLQDGQQALGPEADSQSIPSRTLSGASFVTRLRGAAATCSATEALRPGELQAQLEAIPSSKAAAAQSLIAASSPQDIVRQLVRLCERLIRERSQTGRPGSSGVASEARPSSAGPRPASSNGSSNGDNEVGRLQAEVERLQRENRQLKIESENMYWLADEVKRLKAELKQRELDVGSAT